MPIRNIRAAARQSLRDSQSRPRLLTLLFILCLNGPVLIYTLLDALLYSGLNTESTGIGGFNVFAFYTSAATLVSLVLSFFLNIWKECYQNFTLNLSRGKPVSFRDFTAPFRIFWKVFWLSFLIALYTALWTAAFSFPLSFAAVAVAPTYMVNLVSSPELMTSPILYVFMIPGWIMAYRYRLSFLILFDHEDWSASQAIRESKRLTFGRKMDLFRLDLSYWWYHLPLFLAMTVLPTVLLNDMEEFSFVPYLLCSAAPVVLEMLVRVLFQPNALTAWAHAYHYILEHAPEPAAQAASAAVNYEDGFPVFRGPRDPRPPVFPENDFPSMPDAPADEAADAAEADAEDRTENG